jgi:hypothetical protein
MDQRFAKIDIPTFTDERRVHFINAPPQGRRVRQRLSVSESKFVKKIDDMRFACLDDADPFRKLLMIL